MGLSLIDVAGLVCGYNILDVDEGVFPAIFLQNHQCLIDQVSDIHVVLLRVVNAIPTIH